MLTPLSTEGNHAPSRPGPRRSMKAVERNLFPPVPPFQPIPFPPSQRRGVVPKDAATPATDAEPVI